MIVSRQNKLLTQLAKSPPKITGGSLSVGSIDGQRAELCLELGDQRLKLLAAALTVPYPSSLKRLLLAEPDIEVVLVERAPPGLEKTAGELGVDYLDAHGRGRIVRPGFVYVVPPSVDVRRFKGASRSSPFAPKASRVVRCLLSEHERQWRLSDIAESIELNPGNVHRVLATLVDDSYVEREEDLYVVADPGSLLEAWADISTPSRKQIVVPFEGELGHAVRALGTRLHGKVAVSGEFAAELLAPHLPAESALLHCLDIEEWANLAHDDIRPPLPVGAGIPLRRILVDLSDEGVGQFGASTAGVDAVSPAQLFVDLYKQPTRGRQAADEVRRQLLKF
ncbi:MAG TPA: helix-turn-helix domain-containing protein [Solirubrobacterales bacterium]|jgi:hypothetical protein|nr:helix-turn-helix domain-containing protein [Solirubrobacterales bacterium]